VIGASREAGTIGHRILVGLIQGSYNGPVYPVNPEADHVASIKAYESIEAVPGSVDLAIVCVPAETVHDVVDECHEQGVKALIVVTAGFSEIGQLGEERQLELRDRVYGHGMRMIGPNCLGLINTDPEIQLNASFAPFFPLEGSVAMASQSGALGLAILDYATGRDIGFSYFVSIGNKADVSSNDLIQYWEDDARTEVILLYLESFGNPRRFSRLSRRIGRKKPIVVIKGGRSEAGRQAASSHTAAMASPDVAVDALFQQAGIIPVDSLESMFNVGDMLVNQPLPDGSGVAVVTNSGGPGILCADVCESMGLDLVQLQDDTLDDLRHLLPETASLKNPIDMVASAGPEQYRRVLETVLQDEKVDSVIVIFTPLELDPSEEIAAAIRSGVEDGSREVDRDKPVVGVFIEREDERTQLHARDQRIPTFRFPEDAARTLGKVFQYSEWRRQDEEQPTRMKKFDDFDVDSARELCRARAEDQAGWLGFEDTRDLLSAVGLSSADAVLTDNPDDAVEAANRLGYPVVLKMSSRTLIHKTEWDGLELDLNNEEQVRDAYRTITDRLDEHDKLDELEGLVVQEQIDRGVELMTGMTEDEVFGPLLTFGLGGIHVEILEDISVRLTPLTERDAREMLDDIKGSKLLDGYRGHPPADRDALCDLLLRVSRLVDNVPEIKEIDFNPIKAFPPGEGYRIIDTRIRVAPTS
jgi:acetyl coenzyme A synthetase (ADP forming)-like protein